MEGECPFTLWNTGFLLAWQLLQNKFKVVLQMMPGRLSRSHLNCLFVMYKNLPNLQPAIAAWQSLVYCADTISWVIIFLKPFFCFLFCPCRKHAQVLCGFSQSPLRSLRPSLTDSDGNAARGAFAISFLTPDPCTELQWMSQGTKPSRLLPPGVCGMPWNLGSS